MSFRRFSASVTTVFIGALSLQAFSVDLSGCDQNELDILMEQVKRGNWTTDQVASHCRPASGSDSGSGSSARHAVGKWSWFNGGYVTLTSDGNINRNDTKNVGTYSCNNNSVCTLTWYGGKYIDTMKISEDGNGLKGTNQNGTVVSGRRVK
ncbi:hypothetical protein G3480_25950 [Thiorhodococcus mannitoliphagus]|uniref:DUF995 domain-containing protein n=1 Tax=Thiorhodococcus mannitoliphagus TaxID=329406 RepID=A0A6P1E864_9GAMM|nr:hypothetical protein [Thiorhodococcus mannitoliphagus]NEX23675.1 hypothetical protein [Thiorhodococcus mannitoliphagus]